MCSLDKERKEGVLWQTSDIKWRSKADLVNATQSKKGGKKRKKDGKRGQSVQETKTKKRADVPLVFRVLLTLSSKQGYF